MINLSVGWSMQDERKRLEIECPFCGSTKVVPVAYAAYRCSDCTEYFDDEAVNIAPRKKRIYWDDEA